MSISALLKNLAGPTHSMLRIIQKGYSNQTVTLTLYVTEYLYIYGYILYCCPIYFIGNTENNRAIIERKKLKE